MLIVALASVALAAEPNYPVTVYAGLGGGVGPGVQVEGASGVEPDLSGGGWGVGRATVNVKRFGLDLGLRSGLMAGDLREVGAISGGLRWAPGLPYARVGFVHHHETPWAVVKEDPVMAAIGSAEGIRHRSGLDLAVGLAGAMNPVELPEQRLRAFVELSVIGFPDDHGPHVYGTLDLGFGYSLGRDRSAS